jgi:hypothetical protein
MQLFYMIWDLGPIQIKIKSVVLNQITKTLKIMI